MRPMKRCRHNVSIGPSLTIGLRWKPHRRKLIAPLSREPTKQWVASTRSLITRQKRALHLIKQSRLVTYRAAHIRTHSKVRRSFLHRKSLRSGQRRKADFPYLIFHFSFVIASVV